MVFPHKTHFKYVRNWKHGVLIVWKWCDLVGETSSTILSTHTNYYMKTAINDNCFIVRTLEWFWRQQLAQEIELANCLKVSRRVKKIYFLNLLTELLQQSSWVFVLGVAESRVVSVSCFGAKQHAWKRLSQRQRQGNLQSLYRHLRKWSILVNRYQ